MTIARPGCRACSDTLAPFYATLLANAANIVLEPLLIFGLGWGVRGAAGAIAVAQASCCWQRRAWVMVVSRRSA
jgi:Na+-driven multidrug efflux pump